MMKNNLYRQFLMASHEVDYLMIYPTGVKLEVSLFI